ncbi:hypothetical protein Esti_003054 [Eimeria stiedai]
MPQRRLPDEASPPNVVASEERTRLRSKTPPGWFRIRHFPPDRFDASWQVAPQPAPGMSDDADLGRPQCPAGGLEALDEDEGVESPPYHDDGIDLCCSTFTQHVSGKGESHAASYLSCRKACCRCFRKSKACRRSNSSDCPPADCVYAPHQLRLFCTAGVHGLLLKDRSMRAACAATKDYLNGQEEKQPVQQTSGDASCDAEAAVNHVKRAARCHLCGTFKAKPPSGFHVMRDDALCDLPSRKPTGMPLFEGGGGSAHFGRVPSCDDCGCVLSTATLKGIGTHHLLKQQRPPQKLGEVVAGGVQWGHPTSFWLVESAREEGVEREFRRLLRLNSPESRIALTSCRLLTTVAVVLAALKYGISTYFPPANQIAFICFFCADVLIWLFFSCEVSLRARSMGLRRFSRDQQGLFDTFLQLVGTVALCLRICILANLGGFGVRVFDANPQERTDGIVNDFTISEVHIALVALDTIQLARIYRLAFSCRELFFLTRSILHSLRSLLWTALFVLAVIYTCAIFCTWAYYDEEDAEMRLLWGNLVLSMFTLFTVLTLEGWNNVATATAEKHPFSRIFFVAYICFTTLTLLNIVTGIILDAYVDMSSRLLKEANYKDDLEKDLHNEKVLLSAFEKTSFLVCMRPVSTLTAQGTAHSSATFDQALETWGCGNQPFAGWAGESALDSIVPVHPRESETTLTWRHAAASTSVLVPAASSASQSPRVPAVPSGARFERKLTGVLSEDSTARPSTESATDTEPIQIRAHTSDNSQQDAVAFRTCVKYLRVGGHQPMDILRHPLVQDALQVARIPFYQAFDVLSMYHRRGIQFVTVKEFAEACSRVGGACTGRQLLQVQLELQQKLCAIERSVRSLCRQSTPSRPRSIQSDQILH